MTRRPLSSALSASAGKPVKAIKAATSVETGLLQIQCAASSAPDPALQKLPGETCEVIEIFQSGRDSSGRELTRCFLRLADLDSGIFNGLAVMRRRSGARSGKRFAPGNTCSGARRALAIGQPWIAGKPEISTYRKPGGTGAQGPRQPRALPANLPRIEVVVDIDDQTCPCCQGELHRIGEDKSERLDLLPAQFRVAVTGVLSRIRGRRHAGRGSGPADRGRTADGGDAQVLVSKYADHLPLYRQAQIYARQGIALDRSTLADWVGHAAFHLRPLHERLLTMLRARSRLFADETTVPVLDPGRGRTKTGQLWPMPPTTGPGAASIRQASPMSMHPTARPSGCS